MDLGPHASFIIAAYAMAALVIVCLIAWVLADYDAQRRQLSDLEARGVLRWPDPARDPGERADGALLAVLSWHQVVLGPLTK